jgi:hypothetical protein
MCNTYIKRLSVSIFSGILLLAFVCLEAGAEGAQEAQSVREVAGFDSVSFDTIGELVITQGDREALEIIARARDLPRIMTEVHGGTLSIGWEGPGLGLGFRPPVFRLTMKTIAGLEAHSSGRISAKSLRADSLWIQISSSGGISIDSLDADSLEVRISSSGSLRVAGKVDRQNIILSSSGNYSGENLASRTAGVRVSSSGSATLRASEALDADITSSGDVRYYGAREVNGKVTSSGKLVRLGD